METVTKSPTRSFSGQIVLMVLAALLAGGLGYVVATNMNSTPANTSNTLRSSQSTTSGGSGKTEEPCIDCDKLKLPSP